MKVGRFLTTMAVTVACSRAGKGVERAPVESRSAVRPVVTPAEDSLMAVLGAYRDKRITADSAAGAILAYIARTHKELNLQMDSTLREAFVRRSKARGR